jgi:heme/copper-type cytochrome/quinol oxidase subunit 4
MKPMPNETFQKKNYIQYRWTSEHDRFERQAKLNQALSVMMTVIALVAVVGGLVFAPFDQVIQLSLFGLAVVVMAVNVLYDFRERARRSRNIANALRREREMFDAGASIYANADRALSRFVRRCEAIIRSGGDGFIPLLLDEDEEEQPNSAADSPFARSSASSSLRSRLGSSRFGSSSSKDDDDEDDEDTGRRSRFSSPFSSRSSGSPFSSRTSTNSPFGSSARFGGGRPIGSSGGMRREGNDDPALAGIQTGNGDTGIRFSAYYPKELEANDWHPVKAYAFMGYALDAVTVDAEGGDTDKVPEVLYDRSQTTRHRIPEGAQVTVTPRMKGFQFNPQNVSIGFYRAWHRFDFEIRAVDARLDEATNGYLTFTVDGLIVADVPLSVYVARRLGREQRVVTRHVTRKPYKSVYASFADEDLHLAERLRRIYDALGMYHLRDLMQLRAEHGWSEDMLKAVDDADIFQLFWSEAAANSKAVQRELEYAFDHTSQIENFVRPVYWEQPPTELPAGLNEAAYLPDIAERP